MYSFYLAGEERRPQVCKECFPSESPSVWFTEHLLGTHAVLMGRRETQAALGHSHSHGSAWETELHRGKYSDQIPGFLLTLL